MQASEKLREYGPMDDHWSETGTLVQVFASHTVPLPNLLEENWATVHPVGHFRSVRRVVNLKDGTPGRIYAKSAERTFTAELKNLTEGNSWWGGSRSREKSIFLPNQPIVEERTVWEAVYLLELNRLGILAEKPQAIVTKPNGDKELLVSEIRDGRFGNCFGKEAELARALANAGFLPDDLQALFNDDGCHIIDVNRWEWTPFTKSSRENLLTLIREHAVQ